MLTTIFLVLLYLPCFIIFIIVVVLIFGATSNGMENKLSQLQNDYDEIHS